MNVAIAIFGSRVSPRFDGCDTFLVLNIEDGKVASRMEFRIASWDTMTRVYALSAKGINLLVCGAVDWFSARQLAMRDIEIISWVSGELEQIINLLLTDKLEPGMIVEYGFRGGRRWRFRGRRGRGRGGRGRMM